MLNIHFGRVMVRRHRTNLDLPDAHPTYVGTYCAGPQQRQQVNMEVEQMRKVGAAVPTLTRWASIIVSVF